MEENEIGWPKLFARYVWLVGMAEGSDLLYEWEWKPSDWAAISEALSDSPEWSHTP